MQVCVGREGDQYDRKEDLVRTVGEEGKDQRERVESAIAEGLRSGSEVEKCDL